jgi:uncharacterized protein (DUF302 family)
MLRVLLVLVSSLLFLPLAQAADDGMVTMKSPYSVDETLDRFEKAVTSKGMTVFARVDHAQGAASVDLKLRPTQLLIFGNPKIGTLLMQSNQTAAIDLPLKLLAWQDADGQVWIAYNDPGYLVKRHNITDRDARRWVILLPRLLQNKHSHNRTGRVG